MRLSTTKHNPAPLTPAKFPHQPNTGDAWLPVAVIASTAKPAKLVITLHIDLFICLRPARTECESPRRQPCSLLRFAELQDELVGVSANRSVEHSGRARVRRIGEN